MSRWARWRPVGPPRRRPRSILPHRLAPNFAPYEPINYTHTEMANRHSFEELTSVHRWLDELFLAHQLELLSLNARAALDRLAEYETNLNTHIDDEEKLLIPLYGVRTDHVPGGAVELFTGEHKKIKNFLEEFHSQLSTIIAANGEERKRKTILLFDREAMYKGLLEHHHAREQNVLFPWLDKVTRSDERCRLLDRCASLQAFHSSKVSL